jgi:hypothetical protein
MTSIESPSTPQAPSTADSVREWVNSLPQIYQAQLEYAPKQAEQQVSLAQQYAAPLGQAYKSAQEAMYPETSALQEKLATQASEGMDSSLPNWMREQYLSNLRANLGTNIGSPIAADYTSRGLLEQNKNWQDYYRNLALSVSGRQPLASPGTANYTDYLSGFNPSSVMNYNANTYGSYSNAYANMYNANSKIASQNSPGAIMSGIGNVIGKIGMGAATGGVGLGMDNAFGQMVLQNAIAGF